MSREETMKQNMIQIQEKYEAAEQLRLWYRGNGRNEENSSMNYARHSGRQQRQTQDLSSFHYWGSGRPRESFRQHEDYQV